MYQQLDTGDTDGGDAAPDDAQSASAPSPVCAAGAFPFCVNTMP